MRKYLFLLFLLIATNAYAGGQQTLVTPDGRVLGTASNPLVVTGGGGTPAEVTVSGNASSSDSGKIITYSEASDITITIPSGLSSNFNATYFQAGNGKITIAAGSGVYISNTGSTFGMNTSIALFSTGTDTYNVVSIKGNLPGTTTNNDASIGSIGEFVTSTVASASATSLTTATAKTVTSILLSAGDWDIYSSVDFVLSGTTSTLFSSGPSLTTNTLPTQAGGSGLGTNALARIPLILVTNTGTFTQGSIPVRLSISEDTTLYLVASATFSVGTTTAYGTISARRVR